MITFREWVQAKPLTEREFLRKLALGGMLAWNAAVGDPTTAYQSVTGDNLPKNVQQVIAANQDAQAYEQQKKQQQQAKKMKKKQRS